MNAKTNTPPAWDVVSRHGWEGRFDTENKAQVYAAGAAPMFGEKPWAVVKVDGVGARLTLKVPHA